MTNTRKKVLGPATLAVILFGFAMPRSPLEAQTRKIKSSQHGSISQQVAEASGSR